MLREAERTDVAEGGARPASGRRPALTSWLVLAGLVALSTGLRSWAALRVPSPWFTPDEQTYGELGKSLYRDGNLQILGSPTAFYSLLYPALVGLPLSLGDLELGYTLLKLLQALVMSLAAVPVYLWGRSLMAPRWALVAAALSLAVPGLAFSGFIMTEVAFYPAVCLTAWAMARALERPTVLSQALVLVAIVAATATRLQAIVLAPVLVLAIALKVAFDRTWLGGVRRYAVALGGTAALGLLGAGLRVAQGGSGNGILGAYRTTGEVSYDLGEAVRFTLYHAADLLFMTALFPVLAVAVLAVPAFAGGERSQAGQAYLAVAIALCAGFVVEVGLFTSRLLGRLAERNLLALAPILFLGFALWLDRGAPRPRIATAAAAVASLGLLAYLPWSAFVTAAAEPDAFTIIPLYRLRVRYPDLDIRFFALFAAVDLIVLFALLPRRYLLALPIVAALLLGTASVSASRTVAEQASLFRLNMVGQDRRWVDRKARGPVAFLYAGELSWSGGAPVWVTLFWNRRIRYVYDLFGASAFGPLPQQPITLAGDGRLLLGDGREVRAPYVVGYIDFTFAGSYIAGSSNGFRLWQAAQPVRATTRLRGIAPSGDIAPSAKLTVYGCSGGVLHLGLDAPTDRTVDLWRNGKAFRTLELKGGQPWSGDVPAFPPSLLGDRPCTFEVFADEGVHASRFEFAPTG
jgi:dolichyl-phosphate-mannose-protein mannosyltransferase